MKRLILTETQMRKLSKKLINEGEETYFNTYSAAVQYAREQIEDRGFDIDEDDWWSSVTIGPGKPSPGEYTKHSLEIYKNGKKQRKMLQIQVYNRETKGNEYELNYYIN
jgi:hypothetical protein